MLIRFFILLLLFTSCKSNTSSNATQSLERKNIEAKGYVIDSMQFYQRQIKKLDSIVIQETGNTRNLRYVKKDVPDKSTEGGELEKVFNGKKLVEVKLTYFGEMGKKETQYFLLDGDMYMIKSWESYYDKPMYLNDSKVDSVFTNIFYLFKDNWIAVDRNTKMFLDNSYKSKIDVLLKDYQEEMKNDK